MSKGKMEYNERQGIWKWYYESGELQSTVNYFDDKKHGDQIFHSELGKEVKKEVYWLGELLSETLL